MKDAPISKKQIKTILFLVIMIVTVCLVYSNTLNSPFIFDDGKNIFLNPHIRLTELSAESIREAASRSILSTRSVANISFALNYYFHGYDLPGYHVVNILIHILTCILLYFFIKVTIELVRERAPGTFVPGSVNAEYIAFAAVFIWAVHPLHTQSVTYIVQRMNSMAAMFYILSILLYVKARLAGGIKSRWALYGGSIAAGLFALGSKEIAATLPVFIFLYEWYFFQDLDRAWLKRNLIILSGILAVFGVIAVAYLGVHPFERIMSGYDRRDFTLVQRVLTEFRVVILYITLLVFPHPARLNLDYDFPLSYSLINPVSTLISLMVIVGFLFSAVYLARRERLISFCILWFFGNLAIESSVLALELVYEHRTYLPSMLAVLPPVIIIYRYLRGKWVRVGLLCIVVAVFSLWTYQRNAVWSNELTFLQDCVAKSPNKARPHNNLGLVLLKNGDVEEAIVQFFRSLELEPDKYMIYYNMGNALSQNKRFEEAIYYYKQALELADGKDDSKLFYMGIGNIYEKQGNPSDAIEQFRQALVIDPDFDRAHNYLGKILAQQGMYDEAIYHLFEAVRLNPDYYQAYNNIANTLIQLGKIDEAIKYYNESIRTDPDYIDAHSNLGKLFYQRGQLDKAIEQFQEVVRIDPENEEAQGNLATSLQRRDTINTAIEKVENTLKEDPQNPKLYYQLGELYMMKGIFTNAVENYEKALSILPKFPQALRQIAVVHSLHGDHDTAIAYLKKVVELTPDDPDAHYNLACMYSLAGNIDESVSWLKKAIEKGFDEWELLKKDSDLGSIRMTQFYRELMQNQALGTRR